MSEPHQIAELKAENARLKAEVERLTKENALATPRHLIASQDIKTLREQVERLTKAGDAMALCFNCPTCAKNWHAAKEGKQS
jgi:cell division protein FtsB